MLLAVAAGAAAVAQDLAIVDADPCLVGLEILGGQEAHIVGRHYRDSPGGGQVHAALQALRLVGAAGTQEFQVIAIAEGRQPVIQTLFRQRLVAGEEGLPHIPRRAAGEGDEALRRRRDPVALDLGQRRPLLALEIGAGDEAGQVEIAGLILRQQHQAVGLAGVFRVAHQHLGADDGLDPSGQGGLVKTHQTEEVELIRDGDSRHPGFPHGLDHGLDAQEAVHQRIFTVDVEMNEGRHGW